MLHSHNRQTSVASFASSLYLPVDPENPPNLDDETDTYPSSDELFGPDHEEGDDYTISSRRYLSSHSRYSSTFSHVSHPPTPPRSTRSTISFERPPSSMSLTQPQQSRHSNTELSFSPSAWNNKPVIRTMASTSELPSPPSTARSSTEAPMSAALEKLAEAQSSSEDPGVPIEKFDQLALEHLEQDKALLQMLRKLDDQKLRIAQLTYALSRLRILSNSACLSPSDSDTPVLAGSISVIQPRRLGAVVPKPLIVQQSSKSASSIGRSTLFSPGNGTSGLSGPSTNEAVNQRRRAKQQLHEFALRRPARMAKSRGNGKPAAEDAAATARRVGWEGARGSPSMVMRETKPRAAGIVEHPNITIRRPKRPDPPLHMMSPTHTPRASAQTQGVKSAFTGSPATPPSLRSLFSSPSSTTSKSPQTPVQTHLAPQVVYDSPSTPVPRKRGNNRDKPLPARPVSPTKPMRLARHISYTYEVPPVPSLEDTTAHITLIDRSQATPPLPADEVQNRLAATFAHFSRSRGPSPQPSLSPRVPSPPRKALEFPTAPLDQGQPDYLQHMLHQKWVAQLDEHSHQARGNWKSPLKAIRQKLTGFGGPRRPRRASIADSSSDTHSQSHAHGSFDVVPGYVQGLGTVDEGGDSEYGGIPLTPVPDAKARKAKKKASGKEEGGVLSKATWRFSKLGLNKLVGILTYGDQRLSIVTYIK
ncbi:hypothetical protein AG1IA_05208 [Rhizoctonia solani AG-1 IA]|uniref:Uncharacterized protein n=1 Tax=Thanatephorus cucumeris (strain AG1-IA) TaxID=983506 RepID=L8WS26_THACA|nr:hypothetical protein AG1IA_05208 [Rhizoctonia solani AG-1 IA]